MWRTIVCPNLKRFFKLLFEFNAFEKSVFAQKGSRMYKAGDPNAPFKHKSDP